MKPYETRKLAQIIAWIRNKFQNQSTTEIADDISAERGKTARKTALLPIYSNCLSLVLNLLYFAASWIDLGED